MATTVITRGQQLLNMGEGNTQGGEFRLYRAAGTALYLIRGDGKKLEFKDGWFRTDVLEDIEYMDRELRMGGFGPAVWAATEDDKLEYSRYVDPSTRQVQDVVAQLASNPAFAAQVAQALDSIDGEGAKALAAAINTSAAATITRKITVGGKQHQLEGMANSQTIASVSNGSNSEDTAMVPVTAADVKK